MFFLKHAVYTNTLPVDRTGAHEEKCTNLHQDSGKQYFDLIKALVKLAAATHSRQ